MKNPTIYDILNFHSLVISSLIWLLDATWRSVKTSAGLLSYLSLGCLVFPRGNPFSRTGKLGGVRPGNGLVLSDFAMDHGRSCTSGVVADTARYPLLVGVSVCHFFPASFLRCVGNDEGIT